MSKRDILILIGGLVAGWLIVLFMNSFRDSNIIPSNSSNNQTMTEAMESLQNKTGDEFDKAFISGMIVHHEGAINMANEAKKSAKHDEIKNMADDIISAQSREIDQMKQWYKDWYGSEVPAMDMMSH